MKKLIPLLFIVGTMSIVSCGESTEEKAKNEASDKAKMDSLYNAAKSSVSMDSTKAAAPADTTKK